MDEQKRQLVGIILHMLKDIYNTTSDLETVLQSHSVHILERKFDPFQEMLDTLQIPESKYEDLFQLIKLYVDEKMTLEEVLVEFNQLLEEAGLEV
jgi:hypothetical protein